MNKSLVTAFVVAVLGVSLSHAAAAPTYKVEHNFCWRTNCIDGDQPMSGPVKDASGNFYAVSFAGGAHNKGTVFQISFNGGHRTFKRIHEFCRQADCADGAAPKAGLIIDTNGNLYGTTTESGIHANGLIYELSPNGAGWTYKILHRFCSRTDCKDGDQPRYVTLAYQGAASGAPYDGVSPLYGVTALGGQHHGGAVFELTQTAGKWQEKVIYSFCVATGCPDGDQPFATVTVGATGTTLYGTAGGGAYGHGVVYMLRKRGARWVETVLHSFCRDGGLCVDGDSPEASLVQDASGALYGSTYFGGATAHGSIFKLMPDGEHSVLTTLYSFCPVAGCLDGENPQPAMAMDANGTLFGMVGTGGVHDTGVVFRLGGTVYTPLFSFGTPEAPGGFGESTMMLDSDGSLYGTTLTGGANGHGVLFRVTP